VPNLRGEAGDNQDRGAEETSKSRSGDVGAQGEIEAPALRQQMGVRDIGRGGWGSGYTQQRARDVSGEDRHGAAGHDRGDRRDRRHEEGDRHQERGGHGGREPWRGANKDAEHGSQQRDAQNVRRENQSQGVDK
jgi:hypothetical protein